MGRFVQLKDGYNPHSQCPTCEQPWPLEAEKALAGPTETFQYWFLHVGGPQSVTMQKEQIAELAYLAGWGAHAHMGNTTILALKERVQELEALLELNK